MRVAILSDIHANLFALERVLAAVGEARADEICCLGDIVGYGVFPNECITLLREWDACAVAGNHDLALLGKVRLDRFSKEGQMALRLSRGLLTAESRDYLEALPPMIVRNDLTFVHSSPAEPMRWTYIVTQAEAVEAFGAFATPLCFIGHTHIPVVIGEDQTVNAFRKGVRFLINVGSVGQPRDGDPRAAFGLLDTAEWTYELMRIEYEVEKSIAAMVEAGLPDQSASRLRNGF